MRRPDPRSTPPDAWFDLDPEAAARVAEALRRLALGATLALACARPFWPSEPGGQADTGRGLAWSLGLLVCAGLAIASRWLGGRMLLRRSWVDLCALGLFLLVGLSAAHAADRRSALNLAWEWAGVGCAYLLLRSLPANRGESKMVFGAIAATAVALSALGVYQTLVEYPETRAMYLREPDRALKLAGVADDPASRRRFEDRLLGSTEPTATYALANSLAGFLVGPTVVILGLMIVELFDRRRKLGLIALASAPALLLVAVLLLTKSRSAALGLAAGLIAAAIARRRRLGGRALAIAAAALLGLGALLVAAGLATGRLDREVFTQSSMSLRYRWEYWVGASAVIRERPWAGHGPGNFAGPYLRHKLPQASEEIRDPHNLFLETWAAAGLPALGCLVGALALGLWGCRADSVEDRPPVDKIYSYMILGSLGSLFVPILLGELNPFAADDLARWLVLAAGWGVAVGLGGWLFRRVDLSSPLLGAGVLAVVVNLLAAGGIGMAGVSIGLWGLLAVGLNLREDRPCGRLRESGGRWGAFAASVAWAALVGGFVGAIRPHWEAEASMAAAGAMLRSGRPKPDAVSAAYARAYQADHYAVQPWLDLAEWETNVWRLSGGREADLAWRRVAFALDNASSPPRDPDALAPLAMRARLAGELLRGDLPPAGRKRLMEQRVDALARAALLYPASAAYRAELADALYTLNRRPEADREAREALRLDAATPHIDKKLLAPLRASIADRLARPEAR